MLVAEAESMALIDVCVAEAESMATARTTAHNLCVAVTYYTDVRGEGGRNAYGQGGN